ncbi:MAG: type 1 glutamine amidotransferase [Chthoniobacterales bacterium]|nr:type 1 glutamine amidotransferase [Chthoniobacterales bacterium]
MPKLVTWMRPKDEPFFARAFAPFSGLEVENGLQKAVRFDDIDGLLLTGGADIAPQFLQQPVPDPSVLEAGTDAVRDEWEFRAIKEALARELPILAICKGLQVFNVALGGTLHLDIRGHNAPEMKDHNIQPLRTDRAATHRFELVNSSHHQAIDRLGEGFEVEAWSAMDDIIEQIRLTNYRYALAVQYHPERGGEVYASLFAEFVNHLNRSS